MTEIQPSHNIPELTVSEISTGIKRAVEDNFSYVRVRGEISGLSRPRSGHIYLNLKDESAVLATVCWKGVASKFPFEIEDGLEVICTGRVTTYAGQSKYQLVVEYMEPAGVGALMALLEKRKAQFIKEGLFDADKKQPLPFFPKVIGVVTSPTGAVIRDILHRIENRFPLHVLVWPVQVQGEGAAKQVADAVKGFNKIKETDVVKRPDVIIVARGGGSLEDLWAFNEEVVVRAIAASKIPVISAVGHETDTTLADYAADVRAPTPTAASEIAVPVKSELLLLVDDLDRRLLVSARRLMQQKENMVSGLARGLPKPHTLLEQRIQKLDTIQMRLVKALPNIIDIKRHRLQTLSAGLRSPQHRMELYEQKLQSLQERAFKAIHKKLQDYEQTLQFNNKLMASYHYKRVLERGFAIVKDKKKLVKSAASVPSGASLTLEFFDGEKQVVAKGKADSKKKINVKQGDLF